MENENKYARVYWKLIKKRQDDPADKPFERHHIIPSSIGGSDDETNIVRLTLKEHYIAHLLLTKMGSDINETIKMCFAFHMLSRMSHNSRSYSINRQRHVKFLTELFHPKRNADDEYIERLKKSVTQSWVDAEERRIETAERMKRTMAKRKLNPDFYEQQKSAAKKGGKAAALVVAKRIEYNGKTYLGWSEFRRQTGISKYLYERYYVHGIDPAFRVGVQAWMTYPEILSIIEKFCDNVGEDLPQSKEDMDCVLERMRNIALLAQCDIKTFNNKHWGDASDRRVRL